MSLALSLAAVTLCLFLGLLSFHASCLVNDMYGEWSTADASWMTLLWLLYAVRIGARVGDEAIVNGGRNHPFLSPFPPEIRKNHLGITRCYKVVYCTWTMWD